MFKCLNVDVMGIADYRIAVLQFYDIICENMLHVLEGLRCGVLPTIMYKTTADQLRPVKF